MAIHTTSKTIADKFPLADLSNVRTTPQADGRVTIDPSGALMVGVNTLDDRYYTEAEVDTALAGKADAGTTLAEYGITDALPSSGGTLTGKVTISRDSTQYEAARFEYSLNTFFYNHILVNHGGSIGQNAFSFYVREPTGLSSSAALVISDSGITFNKPPKFTTDVAIGSTDAPLGRLEVRTGNVTEPVHVVLAYSNPSYRHVFRTAYSGIDPASNQLGFGIASTANAQVEALQLRGDGSAVVAGALSVGGAVKLAAKTIATLPSAAASDGHRYRLTDSTPAGRIAFSNGTAWYYEDGTAV